MENFAIAIHGGAQNKPRDQFSADRNEAYKTGLEEALIKGWEVLNKNHSALNAVETAVRVLEDNPLFNAGRGSVFNENGDFEFDAAIMCGKTLKAGAVASVRFIKNPISLARAVMEYSNHVFLCGRGAEEFAHRNEIETRTFDYFENPERMSEWQKAKTEEANRKPNDTVGAVALDKNGNLAAACSTGGLSNKLAGRIGDSPIIGGGIYANNEVCAVVMTGDGEQIMRGVYAHELYALIKYKRLSIKDAVSEVFQMNSSTLKAEMGTIAINRDGNIVLKYNTLPMYRAYKRNHDPEFIAIWDE